MQKQLKMELEEMEEAKKREHVEAVQVGDLMCAMPCHAVLKATLCRPTHGLI